MRAKSQSFEAESLAYIALETGSPREVYRACLLSVLIAVEMMALMRTKDIQMYVCVFIDSCLLGNPYILWQNCDS